MTNFCILHDSPIIWKNEIIHKCPFNQIGTAMFERISNIILSHSKNFLFQLNGNEHHCGETLYLTEEGIYVQKLKERISNNIKNDNVVKSRALTDLILKNIDFVHFS